MAEPSKSGRESGPQSRSTPPDRRLSGSKGELAAAYQAIVNSYAGSKPAAPIVPTPAVSAPPEGKQDLLVAYDRLVEHEANRPAAPPIPAEALWRRYIQPTIIVGCLAAIGYLWLAKPGWLYPRFEPVPPPVSEVEATQLLIATSLMVEDFKESSGRLPRHLTELGIDLPGLSLNDPGDGSWQLLTGVGRRHYLLRGSVGQSVTIEESAQ
jgi:hypothetical protein